MIKKTFLAILALGIFSTSCSSDDDNGPTTSILTLNLTSLEPLGTNFVYEGWIIVDGTPVSTGTLVDSDPLPAATKILAGDFSGNSASVNSNGVVGDFSNASGMFFLRTPTDETGTNNGNDENGVWFGIPGMPPTANFVLPTLPEGWIYEGWVVGDSGPLSTGTFTNFSTVDDVAPFSGVNPGPPIPGEDFFMNAPAGEIFPLDVRGRTVVISVEPVPDDLPGPFVIKPLVGTAGMDHSSSYTFFCDESWFFARRYSIQIIELHIIC